MQFQPHRQLGADARYRRPQMLAQIDDIAPFRHRHRQADGVLSFEAHFQCGRIGIAAVDTRNVTQTKLAVIGAYADLADAFHRIKITRHPEVNAVAGGVHAARRRHRVLGIKAIENQQRLDAQRRKFLVRNFDINFFRLLAQ